MLKNLRSLFIVDDEATASDADPGQGATSTTPLNDQRTGSQAPPRSPAPQTTAPRPDAAAEPQHAPGGGNDSSAARPAAAGAINTAIVAKLLDGVDRNDLEGFDYLEYKRSLKAMESLPMDEATKYRSAFATASTVGATQDKLISSIDYYLNTLDQEKAQFEGVVERQFQDQVAGRRAKLDRLGSEIADKTARIKALEAEIAEHRKEARALEASVNESEAKIENTRRDFEASFEYVRNLFVEDAEKMRRYLK